MASLTPALLADALKEFYTDKEMMKLAYDEHPLLAMVSKDTHWSGKEHVIPIQYARAQGRSAVFTTAQGNTAPGRYEAFKLTTSKDYGVIHIDTETIYASEGTPVRSFVAARKNEADGIIGSLGANLAMQLYRNGGGARGQIATGGITGDVITLAEPNDIVNFEVDMQLCASTADGTSGSLRDSGDTMTVTAVDRDAGTITVSAVANITGLAAADYLFAEGDFGALAKGLDAWLPSAAPGATAFFGVDRSVEPTRLGGIRYSDSNPLVEKFKRAVARGWREGARVTHAFLNPLDWSELEIALADRVQYDRVKSSTGEFMFDSIKMATPSGMVQFVGDPDCPKGVSYALKLSTWTFVSRGATPRVLDPDGKGEFLRQGAADGIEGRFGWFGNLGCRAPGMNIRVALT
jgi:hypothetical protein